MKKPTKKRSTTSRGRAAKPAAEPRLSPLRKPEDLSVEDWQRNLRRQFGREQAFTIKSLGDDLEFAIINPESGQRYRVAIRGKQPGENFCSCPDFATNDLGTCKHIEFALVRIESKRGGKTMLQRGFQPQFSELFLDYSGRRRVRLRLGIDCPPGIRQKAAKLFTEHDGWQLAPDRYAELPAFLEAVRKTGHDLRNYKDAQDFVAEHRDAAERRRILDEAYPSGAESTALEKLLKVELYPYQAEGTLFAVRAGRALIADEMGLGKTVQAIAAIELFARHFGAGRVLIICPTSLKYQWQREIGRFSARDATVIGGSRAMRQTCYGREDFYKITNYETLARDLDLIQSWGPDVVIVDEAQRIKNWNTVAARALKRIDSPYAIVLTGTPLENRLEELISIVQFVDQHRLGPTWRLLHEHQQRDERGRVIGYQHLDKIGQTLSPIMLRRRKTEVLDQLPARVDQTLFVPMTRQQTVFHEENREIVARIVQGWRKTGYLSEKDQIRLTCCLQNMRMSCNSTYLLDHTTDFGHKADELISLLEDMFEDPQAKAVVFSQWLRTHELIAHRLEARGWGHVFFNGGVPSEKRGALVDRFIADAKCRVFLSTDAGGVGLNLQHAAAIVVNMDMPWNPAVLEQRIGRVYRLGQTLGVQVINFVAKGTIEEGMLSVLAFKKSLFAGVLDGGDSEVTLQGTRLSNFMESVEKVTSAAGAIEAEIAPEAEPSVELPAADETAREVTKLLSNGHTEKPHPSPDPWAPLLTVGMQLLHELAAVSKGDSQSRWLETDQDTGQHYLKLPVPDPQAVRNLADSLMQLLSGFK